LPAVRVGKPARPRAARLVRTLRTRWWPRFLLAGVLLVVVGVTLLSGAAKAWVVGAGAAVIFVIGLRSLSMTPADSRVKERRPAFSDGAIVEDRYGDPDNTITSRDGPSCLRVENHIAGHSHLSSVAQPTTRV